MSADKKEEEFLQYTKEMGSWLCVFDKPQMRALGAKFGLKGVPRLIMLNGQTGEVVDEDCHAKVAAEGPVAFEQFMSGVE
mmetsp:Transcript_29916/g.45753  ORF Transcript_29916/g.45753 Transcript_29916/m.45753 type:complete len:80 (-) Transcript_29916:30-269(-)